MTSRGVRPKKATVWAADPAWHPSISNALRAFKPPLPGFSEVRQAYKSLLDEIRTEDCRSKEYAVLSRRIDRLLHLLNEFEEAQITDLSEISRQLEVIKRRLLGVEWDQRSLMGLSNYERKQRLLDELHIDINALVEETHLRLLYCRATGGYDPADNFPLIQPSEISGYERDPVLAGLSHFTSEGRPCQARFDGEVIVRNRYGRLGQFLVIYRTYHTRWDSKAASKFAKWDLMRLSSVDHGNIAMIKGITKGYHGINGIVFAARGVPLEHFLSRANTGSTLVRCFRGLKEALLHDPMGRSEGFDVGNEVIVESNGHAAVCFAVTHSSWIFPGVIFEGILRKLASIESPVTLLAGDLIASSHAYGTSKENQILESIATLGLMRFTEIEIMRIAIEYRMRPTYMVPCSWVSVNEHPLFTIKPGDIGVVVESASVNPVPCWYYVKHKLSAWNPVHQGTSVPGVEYDAGGSDYTPHRGMESESVDTDFTASHGWTSHRLPFSRKETLLLMSHRESLSCYNENEIKSRLVEHRLLERVGALYYCFAVKSEVVIEDLRSNQAHRDPFYFHFKPSSRSTLREFWGFVSTSSDPLVNTAIEKAEVDITYRIEYEAYPLSEMWSLKYERTMRAGLASIPGGYPGAYIEEF